jgi:uncharacterized protein (TIGR03435 family)
MLHSKLESIFLKFNNMKYFFLSSFFLIFSLTYECTLAQTLKVGDALPNNLKALIVSNNKVKEESFENLNKDKVLALEFWATWCSPCIASFPHLDSISKAFGSKMAVIAISNERIEKISSFANKKKFRFTYICDSSSALGNLFKVNVLPTTVLVNKKGIVAAITNPTSITTAMLDSVLNGEILSSRKSNQYSFGTSELNVYLAKANTIESNYFSIEPEIPTITMRMERILKKGQFANRRITFVNHSLLVAYSKAYSTSPTRIINNSLSIDLRKSYMIDCIVKTGEESTLFEFLKESLNKEFQLKAIKVKKEVEVLALYKKDSTIQLDILNDTLSMQFISTTEDSLSFKATTFNDLCKFLEGKAITESYFINKTGVNGKVNLTLSLKSSDIIENFNNQLEKFGLLFKKEKMSLDFIQLDDDFE